MMELSQLKPIEQLDVRHDRPPPSAHPGAASDGVQSILQQGIDMHARLIDHMHYLLVNEEDGEEEWTELLQTVRGLLDEMKKTLNFYPDKTNFGQEYMSFRSKMAESGSSVAAQQNAAVSLSVSIGSYRVDLYRLYFEVIARGGYLKVNQEGSWHQVWEHIGDSGREPRVPLSYEDEAALRNIYVDMLFPFECMNRQRFDCQPGQ